MSLTEPPRLSNSINMTRSSKIAFGRAYPAAKELLSLFESSRPAPGIHCSGKLYSGTEIGFQKLIDCRRVTGYKFDLALLLSVFGGLFGLDRFYLGYPALGCLKFFTFGGFGLWYLIDILLISVETVGPADGSSFLRPYYDPIVKLLCRTNFTVYAG
ncbi:unnamed protein product [Schistosoma margrebowiei]|uniref:TM2 domain-containing protein n=1 Tax=Schistosoma margrebowiei TaxID=48269 RepID=A0AA84Z655_9TREM|nr:unnamed protein product [Schistosoma margrebowiei]